MFLANTNRLEPQLVQIWEFFSVLHITYKLIICEVFSKKKDKFNFKYVNILQDGWLSKHRGQEQVWKYNLHILCLSPDIVFSELLGARSIVIASGTLSPIDSFEAELGVKFPWVVHGRHVVAAQNVISSYWSFIPMLNLLF